MLLDYITLDDCLNYSAYKSTFPEITNLKFDNLLYNITSSQHTNINLNSKTTKLIKQLHNLIVYVWISKNNYYQNNILYSNDYFFLYILLFCHLHNLNKEFNLPLTIRDTCPGHYREI